MSDRVAQWLQQLGLTQYAEAFEQNAIALEHLPDLDHDTLKEIGVHAVGHRLTLLKAAATMTGAATGTSASGTDAERRQLSVMFCDLAGSTALSERLDLEAYRDLLGRYHDAARTAIERYGGYIARYMGDGLLVYFGYPHAHEDDAERAVRAGLDAIAAVSRIPAPDATQLQVRVGIATGRVVAGDIVGEGASEERAVLGETPNLAARLQGLATPNTVVISDATRHLVEGRFELDALDPSTVKGFQEPVLAYRATALRSSSRFDAATARGLSAFVGRRGELDLLLERWRQAGTGDGQVVLLAGEAGIGKSRMLRELSDRAAASEHVALRYQCSPYTTKTAFAPFIEQLQHHAGIRPEDPSDAKLDKLEQAISCVTERVPDAVALLAALLSIPCERYPPLALTPPRQKLETVTALVIHLEELARRQPVLVLVEDVHWVDPSSLDTLSRMVDRAQELPVLMVMAHRPEFESPWTQLGHVTHLSLNRLDRADAKSLTEQLTGGKELPGVVLDQILARTDGVPLFIEELTKTVLEAKLMRDDGRRYVLDGLLPPLAIPSTLQDSLMARLDRLAPVKEVAQAAACIGREFETSLLAQMLDRPSLRDDLQQLLEAGLIFRRGSGDAETFIFKHALVQDTAYESLLISRRQQLHARIASALESSHKAEPGTIARHCSAAGLAAKAAAQFLAAGRRALSVSALLEAANELELGLHETQHLAPGTQRDRLELDLRTSLGAARIACFGWPHPSVGAAYGPAFALAEKVGDRKVLGPILWGLCVHYWCRGEFPETHHWLALLEKAADASKDSELSVVRDMTAGCQYFWEADYDRAFRYTARVRKTYDEAAHASIAAYTNHDPLTFSLHWAGSLLQWIVGYPELALELAEEAHALARRIGHPFNCVFALTAGSEALLMRGDTANVLRCCDEAQAIVDDEGLGEFAQQLLVNNWRGRALIQAGAFEEGHRLASAVRAAWHQAEGKICSAMFWRGEALGLLGLGRTREAAALIEDAIAHCRTTGDRYMEPEVVRVKAEILLARDGAEATDAESTLRESLELARAHDAKSWELRTATSLARYCWSRNKQDEARDLLAPVYDWFTEGFETSDLREARALLEQLS